MIRLKHPSRHFIYFLISRRSMTPEQIIAQLMELGLPVPTGGSSAQKLTPRLKNPDNKKKPEPDRSPFGRFIEHIREAQRTARFPPGFNPRNKERHTPTLMWLKEHRILDMWGQDRGVRAAYDYLLDPQISRMLMILLLGPISFSAIADRVSKQFGLDHLSMNPRVVRFFSHYFWNHEMLNTAEWRVILRDWMTYDTTDMDMAVSAPRSSVGAALAICMADQGVSESLKEVVTYRHVRDSAFMEYAKAVTTLNTGVNKALTMNQLVDAMVKGQDQLDQRRGGSAELLEELRRIEATYDASKLTSIKELPLDRLPDTIDVTDFEIVKEK